MASHDTLEVVSSKLDAPQNQPQMHLALHPSGETIGRFGLDSSALPCQQHFFSDSDQHTWVGKRQDKDVEMVAGGFTAWFPQTC